MSLTLWGVIASCAKQSTSMGDPSMLFVSPDFGESIVNHAIASGRDANCFFQSFFHTLTQQPPPVFKAIECHYKQVVDVFVETFNKTLCLEPPAKFDEIIAISTSLHPLERECVFGPILRFTYNAMIDKGLLAGSKLELHP
ncbi:MAG: hypothetical protein HY939_02600, partial [Gammaproteobacteria bacterium]|nr:hypothetical protein [Gammaproteobacteria bacterium]